MHISTLLKLEHTTQTEELQLDDRQKDHAYSNEMHPTGTEALYADQEINLKV
jgi:hypothetical protein